MNPWQRLLAELEARRVRYVLVGGLAVSLHGVPRLTADLDLALALDERNAASFLGVMSDLGYQPRLPVDPSGLADEAVRRRWAEEKGLVVFPFWHPESPFADVGVLLSLPVPFEELWETRVTKRLAGVTVLVASITHLKVLKRAVGRTQDLADIDALERVEELSRRGTDPEVGRRNAEP